MNPNNDKKLRVLLAVMEDRRSSYADMISSASRRGDKDLTNMARASYLTYDSMIDLANALLVDDWATALNYGASPEA